MKKEVLQRAKGVRDFGPEEKIARDQIVDSLKIVFEKYGYNPLETPVLERYDLFASKFGLGQESDSMKETFKLKDQGNRDLVLRTEFTVPLARYIAMNKNLRLPFKRYQIGSVFRDGPIKLGRYREFYQCDVDCVGVANMSIDAELLYLINDAFKELGLEVEILINNRQILNQVLDKAGVSKNKQESVIITLDKLEKVGATGVKAELKQKGIDEKTVKQILSALDLKKLEDSKGLQEIQEILKLTKSLKNVKFVPTLARGLAYYTGTVFEVFLKDKSKISSSVAGGGRYDNMIAGFSGSKENVPAVGVSFGLETIFDALALQKKEAEKTVVQAYVAPVGEEMNAEALSLVKKLRDKGLKVDLDFLAKKVGKSFEYADKAGIEWVIVVGEDEVKTKKFSLKNMKTGKQEQVSVDNLIKKIGA